MTTVNPGWYRDPRVAGGMLAYWDGQAWTDNRQPLPADLAKLEARPTVGGLSRAFWAFALLFPTCGLSLLFLVPQKSGLDKRRAALAKQGIYV